MVKLSIDGLRRLLSACRMLFEARFLKATVLLLPLRGVKFGVGQVVPQTMPSHGEARKGATKEGGE